MAFGGKKPKLSKGNKRDDYWKLPQTFRVERELKQNAYFAVEDQRAPFVPSSTSPTLAEPKAESTVDPRGTSQADAMATQTSRTYLRRLTKRHFVDYTEPEVGDDDEDEDDDEDDDEDEPEDEDDDEDSDQEPQLQTYSLVQIFCLNFNI